MDHSELESIEKGEFDTDSRDYLKSLFKAVKVLQLVNALGTKTES